MSLHPYAGFERGDEPPPEAVPSDDAIRLHQAEAFISHPRNSMSIFWTAGTKPNCAGLRQQSRPLVRQLLAPRPSLSKRKKSPCRYKPPRPGSHGARLFPGARAPSKRQAAQMPQQSIRPR
jgi:hypothetical protein